MPPAWRLTLLMTLAYMVNFMNQGIVLVVAEQLKIEFTLTDAKLGMVIGLSYMLFSAVGAVPLGRIADIYPRGLIVGSSLALMGAATAMTAMVQSYGSLLIMRAVAGTGDAGVLPGAVSLIGDRVSAERRPLALSVFNAGASIGALAVYLLMGHVAQFYGWRAAYVGVGALGIAVGLLISLALPEQKRHATAQPIHTGTARTLIRLLRISPYFHIVFALIAFGMTTSATWNWTSPVMQRTYGLSVAEAGMLLGVGAGVATVLGSLSFGMLSSRLQAHSVHTPVKAAAVMQVCSALCLCSGLSLDSSHWMSVLILGGFFFAGSNMVIVFWAIQQAVPADSRSLAVGLALLLFSLLGQGVGPLVTGAATDYLTPQYGSDALRRVMQLAMVMGTAWACMHLLCAARAMRNTSAVR